jgi:hypothetical protein
MPSTQSGIVSRCLLVSTHLRTQQQTKTGLTFTLMHCQDNTSTSNHRATPEMETQLRDRDENLHTSSRQNALDEELKRLRAEIAAPRKPALPTRYHDYSEAQTRDIFYRLLLKEAGWRSDQPRSRV